MRGSLKAAFAATVTMALAGGAHAGTTFFQFNADPDSVGDPSEFVYDATAGLTHGPGALGNNSLFSSGLTGVITGGLSGIPNSPPGFGPGPTYSILSDLTMLLSGFPAVGNAVVGPSTIQQGLGAGSFVVQYDAGGTLGVPLILLTGTTSSALLTEKNSGEAGVLSGVVTYTGGLLAAQLAGAGYDNTGTFSFAMTGLHGPFSTVPVGSETHLAGFDADGVGTFDANPIPEPTVALGASAMFAYAGLGRRRRA